MAIIVTAGAGDACCIIGRLHIQAGGENERLFLFLVERKALSERLRLWVVLQQLPPGAAVIKY